jgi:Protein of unknown function (DUF3551)
METNMKTAFAIIVAFVAFFTLTSIAPERAAAAASLGPQRESWCMVLGEGGTYCDFISLAQCQASASGRNAQCYPALPADNQSAFARSGMPRRHDPSRRKGPRRDHRRRYRVSSRSFQRSTFAYKDAIE